MDIAAVLRNSSGEVSQYLQGRPCTPLSWESKTNTTTSEDSAWGYTAHRLVRELRLNPKAQEYVFIKHAIKNHAVSSVSPLGLQYGRSACLLAFNSITASFSFLLHLLTEKTHKEKTNPDGLVGGLLLYGKLTISFCLPYCWRESLLLSWALWELWSFWCSQEPASGQTH